MNGVCRQIKAVLGEHLSLMIINSKTYREDLLNRFDLTSSLSMPCRSINPPQIACVIGEGEGGGSAKKG